MKFSEQWLREWVNPSKSTEELCHQLTMAGLEIESSEPVAPAFNNVVVAQITSATKHPNADKLTLCSVNTGSHENLPVVCGGVNITVGMKVALAKVGAVLPGDFKIKSSTIRGEQSEGMLCAIHELGLGEPPATKLILELPEDAPLGMDLREYLSLNDNIIDIDLTPNRGDCLSILGVAREVAAINAISYQQPPAPSNEVSIKNTLKVIVDAKDACPCYLGRIIKKIDSSAKTPLWMQQRLIRSGIRTLHPVVDISNYVMLELGQPLHAFDLSCLKGDIQVRFAEIGETLKLLDDREIELTPETLVIADDKLPLALAGVMGGVFSGVTDRTKDVFLESAFFDPILINKTSQRYSIQSDSAYRFSRGVDFTLQSKALERMTQLILEICGGECGPITKVIHENALPSLPNIDLRTSRITRIIGMQLADKSVENYLDLLGMKIKNEGDHFTVIPPSHRFDIRTEIDLVEEVARLYGYDNIPLRAPEAQLKSVPQPIDQIPLTKIQQFLVAQGFHETINYSFVDPKLADALSQSTEFLKLINPISSEMSVMRENHWPGLIQTYLYNSARQEGRHRYFETGLCFSGSGKNIKQNQRIGGLISGEFYSENWINPKQKVEFYTLKGVVEGILELSIHPNEYTYEPSHHPALHPGQSADLKLNGITVGSLGLLHPQWRQKFGIKAELYLFDLDLGIIINTLLPHYQAVSKFPTTRRDIAVVVEQSLPVAKLLSDIKKVAGSVLYDTQIFDVYMGEGIDPGHKSIAIGLTFNDPTRTLVDEEVNTLMDKIIKSLATQFHATLRI